MKKYLVLVMVTLLSIGASYNTSNICDYFAYKSTYTAAYIANVSDSIISSGKIQSGGRTELTSEVPFIVKDVFVEQNKEVKEGDKILSVDVLATKSLFKNMGISETLMSSYKIPEEIKADHDGIIKEVNFREKSLVNSGNVFCVIESEFKSMAIINVSEKNISNVSVGMEAIITGSAFGEKKYIANIISISDTATQVIKGTSAETVIECMAAIENSDELVRNGCTVKATMIYNESENCVIVPYEAVLQNNLNEKYVYLLTGGIFANKKKLDILDERFEGIVVSNLNGDEKLIEYPNEKIANQTSVRLKTIGKVS